MVALDLQHVNHSGIEFAAVGSELRATVTGGGAILEAVAGGVGFVNTSGAVTLDLALGRAFHQTMVGNYTSFAFSNIPASDEYSASWTWVLRIDATGGYTLPTMPAVTFVDGRSFADADLTANAENIFTFWRVGTTTYGALVTNGSLELEPYVMTFLSDATLLVPVTQTETIDLGGVTHLEVDGTAGTGTLSYTKDGATVSGATGFVSGEVLGVARSGGAAASCVSIPRGI